VHLYNLPWVPHASPITESASGYDKFVATRSLLLPCCTCRFTNNEYSA
jgi:hypothetical protein